MSDMEGRPDFLPSPGEMGRIDQVLRRSVAVLLGAGSSPASALKALTKFLALGESDVAEMRNEFLTQSDQLKALAVAQQQYSAQHEETVRTMLDRLQTLSERVEGLHESLASLVSEAQSNRETSVALDLANSEIRLGLDEVRRAVSYAHLVSQLKVVLAKTVPAGSHVAVISKGDEELLDIDGCDTSHFPQDEYGRYAGFHPRDSAEAISHLESLRSRGLEYLVIPQPFFWWLNHYADLRLHLEEHYRRVWEDARCIVFELASRTQHAAPVGGWKLFKTWFRPRATNGRAGELHASDTDLRANKLSHDDLRASIHRIIGEVVPLGSRVLFVSRGDEDLLQVESLDTAHFPGASDGSYLGYYPADSGAAINELEMHIANGATFLVFPRTAFWWFEHFGDFRDYLDRVHSQIRRDDDCVIYELSPSNLTRRGLSSDIFVGNGKDIICFPVIDWDFRFQRPQQLLREFARRGHRVFYVRTKFHQDSQDVTVIPIEPGVWSVGLPGPSHVDLYAHSIDENTLVGAMEALDRFRGDAEIRDAVSLVDLPFWGALACEARRRWGWKIVYDCMDDHEGFSTNREEMLVNEKHLVHESDLILATSDAILRKIMSTGRTATLVPNATDFSHFNNAPATSRLDHLDGPIIGYYGAISDWFDDSLLYEVAQARPDWNFVLVGDTFGARTEWLETLPNVYFVPEQPYTVVPEYLQAFDVACIPFRITPLTKATNPVKFFEYLSAGKPVASVRLPELDRFSSHCYFGDNAAEFIEGVERALRENGPEKVTARIDLARNQTWAHRCDTIESAIRSWYKKASIIIVSYNNADCLHLCLESIWSRTQYPNFEVIVVDNGSSPEVLEYLESVKQRESRLSVIANGENLGFAKANNIGIKASDSEYVVLLNDDTVVTTNWLGKIARYLEDERIGLVGPVSNWAGNEARIDVSYHELDQMQEFADRHGRDHAGRSFDIPMLAMYCIGIRRSLLDRIGGLDERFGIGMFEDDDFALRVRRASYRIVCAEDMFIHHWGRTSFSRLDEQEYERLFERNRRLFEEKWGEPWIPHQSRPLDAATR